MNICVRFYGIAYDYTKVREWHPELDEIVDVSQLLKMIIEYFPDMKELIYDKQEKIRDYLGISINNKDIKAINGYKTQLKDGDLVFITPPIGGG